MILVTTMMAIITKFYCVPGTLVINAFPLFTCLILTSHFNNSRFNNQLLRVAWWYCPHFRGEGYRGQGDQETCLTSQKQ